MFLHCKNICTFVFLMMSHMMFTALMIFYLLLFYLFLSACASQTHMMYLCLYRNFVTFMSFFGIPFVLILYLQFMTRAISSLY